MIMVERYYQYRRTSPTCFISWDVHLFCELNLSSFLHHFFVSWINKSLLCLLDRHISHVQCKLDMGYLLSIYSHICYFNTIYSCFVACVLFENIALDLKYTNKMFSFSHYLIIPGSPCKSSLPSPQITSWMTSQRRKAPWTKRSSLLMKYRRGWRSLIALRRARER